MPKHSRYHKIFLLSLGFFLLLVLMAVFHENGILNAYQLEQKQFEIRQENETLRKNNAELRLEIISLKSDPYAIEKIARERFMMVRPGEKVFRVIDVKTAK